MSLHQLKLGYGKPPNALLLANNLSETINSRQLVALVGPNGTGKSTLLRTIAGIQNPLAGKVRLMGRIVSELSVRQLAKYVSVVLTDQTAVGYVKAEEVVAMGRFPHTGWLGSFLPTDRRKVNLAIRQAGISHLLTKPLHQLSDGERQKVMIARALAQDTPLMLLDEPTTHLDVANRVSIIELLRQLVRQQGKSIIFSTHDIELALQVSDRIWLMHSQSIRSGTPEDLVLSGLLTQVMGSQQTNFDPQSGSFRVVTPGRQTIGLKGSGIAALWTQRALERSSYQIRSEDALTVVVISGQEWQIIQDGQIMVIVSSIEELLQKLSTLTQETPPLNKFT